MLDDIALHSVNALDLLGRDNFLVAHRVDPPIGKEQEPVAVAQRKVDVVQNRSGGDAPTVHLVANFAHDLLLIGRVEIVRRLVKQQRVGALDERTGKDHLLILAARKLVRVAKCALGQVKPLKRVFDDLSVFLRRAALHVGTTPQKNGVVHGQPVRMAVLRDEGHLTGAIKTMHLAKGTPSSSTRPDAGFAAPVRQESKVDLPHPFTPKMAKNEPGTKSISTPCKIGEPARYAKCKP